MQLKRMEKNMEENKFKIIILIVFIAITLHFIIMSLLAILCIV